jgi:hypothetical protein
MFGRNAVEDSSTVMRDNERAVENVNGERRHGKEIHGDVLPIDLHLLNAGTVERPADL